MSARPTPDDDTPIFLIPRIPGTGIMAIIGLSLVVLAVISASIKAWTTQAQPAEQTVRLTGDTGAVIEELNADPIGEELWRWSTAEGAVLLVGEADGLWAYDLDKSDYTALRARLRGADVRVEEMAEPER